MHKLSLPFPNSPVKGIFQEVAVKIQTHIRIGQSENSVAFISLNETRGRHEKESMGAKEKQ